MSFKTIDTTTIPEFVPSKTSSYYISDLKDKQMPVMCVPVSKLPGDILRACVRDILDWHWKGVLTENSVVHEFVNYLMSTEPYADLRPNSMSKSEKLRIVETELLQEVARREVNKYSFDSILFEGQWVWYVDNSTKKPDLAKVISIQYDDNNKIYSFGLDFYGEGIEVVDTPLSSYDFDEFGRNAINHTVFLTKEDAEIAIKKGEWD